MNNKYLRKIFCSVFAIFLAVLPDGAYGQTDFTREYATVYGNEFIWEMMANGQRYDPEARTVAHRTLPFGTRLRLVNPKNRNAVEVEVQDRMLPVEAQSLRLSLEAARRLGMRIGEAAQLQVFIAQEEVEDPTESIDPDDLISDVTISAPTGSSESTSDSRGAPFEQGKASYYGARFHGRTTASGEKFDMNALTAAHPSLPFGTIVEVVNRRTGESVQVTINDRGPFSGNRILDLSRAAASALGILRQGVAGVSLYLVDEQSESVAPEPASPEPREEQNVEIPAAVIEPERAVRAPVQRVMTGRYTVLLYNLDDRDRAEQQAGLFEGGWVQEAQAQGQTRYFVNIGRYETVQEANSRLLELTNMGYIAFVKVVDVTPEG